MWFFFGPFIEKMETIDLKAPQVTIINAYVFVQLTQELQGNLNEPDHQLEELISELMKTVLSITLVTP
jgi:hypothetical protein